MVKVETGGNEPNYDTETTRTSSKSPEFNVDFITRKKPECMSTFEIPEIDELSEISRNKLESPIFKYNKEDMRQNHCAQCNVSFRYDKHYAKHCHELHGIKQPFPCGYCKRMFGTRRNLVGHVNNVHGLKNNPYTRWKKYKRIVCDECQETIFGWTKFEQHAFSKHEGIKMMSCSHCPKKFLRRKHVLRHEKMEHGNLEVKCDICKNIFDRSDLVKEHLQFCRQKQIRNKTGDDQVNPERRSVALVCEECGDEHVTYTLFRDHHRLKHPHVKLHHCEDCDATFSNIYTLEKHADMLHPDNAGKIKKWRKFRRGTVYTCEHCNENFAGTSEYEKHGKQHPGLPMFRCKDCGQGYCSRNSLTKHANEIHRDVKTRCSYCSKCYFRIRVHEKECEKKIEKRERKRMAGYPKHYCGLCKRDFYVANVSFRKHVERHKYYECCAICGQRFKKNSNRLSRHMVLRHLSGDSALEVAVEVQTIAKPEPLSQKLEDFQCSDVKDLTYAKLEDHDLYIYAKSEGD